MSHDTPTITAQPRERTGTRYSRRLRQKGRLPAIIYGHKTDPLAVHIDHKELITAIRHGAHLMNVSIEGRQTETCLVKELQFGFLGDNVIHADLTRVDLDEQVEVAVRLHFVGEAEAAKSPGAILNTALTELEIACKASDIPDEIRVDLSIMKDNMITVEDITLPEGVTTTLDPSTPVVQITFVHEEEAEGEEVEVEAAAAPEVITEAKPKDEDD